MWRASRVFDAFRSCYASTSVRGSKEASENCTNRFDRAVREHFKHHVESEDVNRSPICLADRHQGSDAFCAKSIGLLAFLICIGLGLAVRGCLPPTLSIKFTNCLEGSSGWIPVTRQAVGSSQERSLHFGGLACHCLWQHEISCLLSWLVILGVLSCWTTLGKFNIRACVRIATHLLGKYIE